jgi:NAD(P)-dependent dehydrogenase (short-subunit alcohol dehydrogenase family)
VSAHLDLGGRHVLVTGGAGALGVSIATSLIHHGATVSIVDVLDEEEARGNLGAVGQQLRYLRADVGDEQQVGALFDALARDGLPGCVCAHAGATHAAEAVDFPVGSFDAIMRLNLRGSFLVAREAARRWIARGSQGHLIFTTSWVQDVAWPHITPYAASKAGLRALMRGFAHELAPHGIRANAVAPGIVAAGMALEQWQTDPAYRARTARALPLGKLQPPESIGDAFAFLCSDLATWMTGSTLLVDGGASLYPFGIEEGDA